MARAGVIEDGEWSVTGGGDGARGIGITAASNVYLHYVFDLWADQWRRRNARGDVILSRFADDYVAGFDHREDAERFLPISASGSRSSVWSCIRRRRG